MNNMRRGFSLIEIAVAAALLAVLIGVSAQMVVATNAQRPALEKRAIALQQAANIIERVTAWPWQDITAERLASVKLAPSVTELLPGAALKLSVEPAVDAPPGKHVRVEISWTNAAGGTDSPVRLNYWAYARPGEKSP